MYQSNPKMRPPQAAEHLGIAVSTLAKKRHRGDGPIYSKLGRIILYEKSDLDNWVAANRRTSTSDQPETPKTVEELAPPRSTDQMHT